MKMNFKVKICIFYINLMLDLIFCVMQVTGRSSKETMMEIPGNQDEWLKEQIGKSEEMIGIEFLTDS